MKKLFIQTLKVSLPLGLGVFLIWYFYNSLSIEDRKSLFNAFKNANYSIVFITFAFGWLSHFIRGVRWRYLLEPLGYKVSVWNSYHSVMIGYIINIIFPRAGEASRAGMMAKYEGIKFDKAFGSIFAERVIDLLMLGLVTLLYLALGIDNYEMILEQIQSHPLLHSGTDQEGFNIFALFGAVIKYGIIIGFISVVILFIIKPTLREKIRSIIQGFAEGLKTILKTPKKGLFIFQTILIWVLYVGMFYFALFALPETSEVGFEAGLAGFIAGTVGIILVQGGLGVYPILVGVVLSIYLQNPESSDAYAIGWIIWVAQTLLVVIFGSLSLYVMPRINKTVNDNELASSASK